MNLRRDLEEDRILTLIGPTGSGKTFLIIEEMDKYPIEVISADSRQIYKYMDIGTAKPTLRERKIVPHHLIDVIKPDERFSAFEFYRNTLNIIREIRKRGKIPLIVGGTGLYIRSLQSGLFKMPEIPENIREDIRRKIEKKGVDFAYKELKRVDAETASTVHPNDRQRISRALEVYLSTGIPISEWKKKEHTIPIPLDIYCLKVEKEKLLDRIKKRIEDMFINGWEQEVRGLLNRGYNEKDYGFTSLGYREVLDFIRGRYKLEEVKEIIFKKTKAYIKRQNTFFRGLKGVKYINYSSVKRFITALEEKIRNEENQKN